MRTAIVLVAILAGLASGPSALEAGAASVPPLDRLGISMIVLFCLVAVPALLGFQAAFRRSKPVVDGWSFFAVAAIFFLAAGVSAMVFAVQKSNFQWYAALGLAVGLGLGAGLVIARRAFARHFMRSAGS